MPTRIITSGNRKGGVSKTNLTINLAYYVANYVENSKVLIFEADEQASIPLSLGYKLNELKYTVMDVILENCSIKDAIVKTKFGFDILPANKKLSELELIVFNNKDIFKNSAYIFKDMLSPILSEYTHIFFDTPPSLGLSVVNALSASTDVIIPMQLEYLSAVGISDMLDTISNVKKTYNPQLNLLGVVATMHNRTSASNVILQDGRKNLMKANIKLYDNVIYRSAKIAESVMAGEPALVYAPEDRLVSAYFDLGKEVFGE